MKITKDFNFFNIAKGSFKVLLVASSVMLFACDGSDNETVGGTTDGGTADGGTTDGGTSGAVDITNAILENTSGDCAEYDNSYEASVLDVQNDTSFEMDVIISSDDTSCTLTSNNIPNHDFNETGNFVDAVTESSQDFTITRSPTIEDSPTALAQNIYNAVMINGVPLDLLSAGCYVDGVDVQIGCSVDDDWLLDPLGPGNGFGADEHNAHTQPGGLYHYHGSPEALFDSEDDSIESPVIGFAADGFPIYGTYFFDSSSSTIRKATSSYSLKTGSRGETSDSNPGGDYDGRYIDDFEYTEGLGDLDECNGMTVDGQYGYYVTESYPWVMACMSGSPDASFSKGGGGGGR